MRKTILQEQHTCSLQKIARKNAKYWRKERILKISYLAKATAFAKWSVWVKKNAKNMRKTIVEQQHSYSV